MTFLPAYDKVIFRVHAYILFNSTDSSNVVLCSVHMLYVYMHFLQTEFLALSKQSLLQENKTHSNVLNFHQKTDSSSSESNRNINPETSVGKQTPVMNKAKGKLSSQC